MRRHETDNAMFPVTRFLHSNYDYSYPMRGQSLFRTAFAFSEPPNLLLLLFASLKFSGNCGFTTT